MKDAEKVRAGSLGGTARMKKYGNPGTPEGRRLGGMRSYASIRIKGTAFKLLRKIKKPRESERLAELMGILAGDGHLAGYQVTVTTNADTDIQHAQYVRALLEELFGIPVSITKRNSCNAVVILLSSKAACDFLHHHGMIKGNKVAAQITPPDWVLKNINFRKAYLRGLIDTDGSAYFDKHRVKGKTYASICMAFTNASVPLLDFTEQTLKECGYHPTRFGRHVRLRRREEVLSYMKTIGFHNAKHVRRIGV